MELAETDNTATEQPSAGPPATRHGRPRWLRRIVVAGVCLMALVVVLFVLQLRRPSEVQRFQQPESVTYADGRRHIAVLHRIETPGSMLGLTSDHYELVLGSASDYGHVVTIGAGGLDPTDLDVTWEPDGARVTYGSGHELFVPAEAFTFGR